MKHKHSLALRFVSLLTILLSFSPSLLAQKNNFSTNNQLIMPSETREQFLDGKFQALLQSSLSDGDYQDFNANLGVFSASYRLKDGGTYYEARHETSDEAFSNLVVYPSDVFYLSYRSINSNELTYITNDGRCNKKLHYVIALTVKIFNKNATINFAQSLKEKHLKHSCNKIYKAPI